MRDASLDHLNADFRTRVFELIARLAERGVAVMVINTLRSEAEHQEDLANGRSWVKHSKHQACPPGGLADAVDLCPYAQYELHGPDKLQWDAGDPVWETIARQAETLGLRSGYRWKQRDCGHVEIVR